MTFEEKSSGSELRATCKGREGRRRTRFTPQSPSRARPNEQIMNRGRPCQGLIHRLLRGGRGTDYTLPADPVRGAHDYLTWWFDQRHRLVGRSRLMTLLWVLLAAACGPALAEKRVALVVGNSTYEAAGVPKLLNPGNDARLIAEALRKTGFTLVGGGAQLNLQKRPFEQAVRAFRQQLSGADVGVFYYAGHGMQVGKLNYLMPVDADPKVEDDVETDMLRAELVVNQMQAAGVKLKLIILDACRDNPLPPAARGLIVARGKDGDFVPTRSLDSGGGLGRMDAPQDSGTVIAFATAPGMVALDGSEADSPYSAALAEAIGAPDLDLLGVFSRVNDRVKDATGGRQQPWLSGSFGSQFRFASATTSVSPAAASRVSPSAPVPASARPASGADETAWNYLKATTDVAALRQFVLDFPAGSHLEEAQARIASL
jgi:uncharacterized caspase-like protein